MSDITTKWAVPFLEGTDPGNQIDAVDRAKAELLDDLLRVRRRVGRVEARLERRTAGAGGHRRQPPRAASDPDARPRLARLPRLLRRTTPDATGPRRCRRGLLQRGPRVARRPALAVLPQRICAGLSLSLTASSTTTEGLRDAPPENAPATDRHRRDRGVAHGSRRGRPRRAADVEMVPSCAPNWLAWHSSKSNGRRPDDPQRRSLPPSRSTASGRQRGSQIAEGCDLAPWPARSAPSSRCSRR
jgi:hypothetical protein